MNSRERFPGRFWILTAASMAAGGYGIMLLSLTLMYGNDAGFSPALAGLLSSIFAFASLGIRPFSGLWCDRWSKRTLLLLSGAGFALTPAAFLLDAPYAVLAAARAVQGVCLGIATTAAGALATQLIPRSRFTEGIGYYGIGMAAASAVAPGIGLWLYGRAGYPGVFLFSGGVGLGMILLSLLLPPSGHVPGGSARKGIRPTELFEPSALFATTVTLVLTIGQVTAMQFLGYYVQARGANGTGVFYPLSAAAVIAVRLGGGALRRRFSDAQLLYTGIALLMAAYGGLSLLYPSSAALAVLALFYGLGHSLSGMVLNAMALAQASPERTGAANATYLAASDLGYAAGPVLWNLYASHRGYHAIFVAPSLLSAAMLIAVMFKGGALRFDRK